MAIVSLNNSSPTTCDWLGIDIKTAISSVKTQGLMGKINPLLTHESPRLNVLTLLDLSIEQISEQIIRALKFNEPSFSKTLVNLKYLPPELVNKLVKKTNEKIKLSQNQLQFLIECAPQLTELKIFPHTYNSSEILEKLPPTLQCLDLSNSSVSDVDLAKISCKNSLLYLKIDFCKNITGGSGAFQELVSLVVLQAARCFLTDQNLANAAFKKTLKELNIIKNSEITGGSKAFENLEKLEKLIADGCPLTEENLANASFKATLKELSIEESSAICKGFEKLYKWPHLTIRRNRYFAFAF